MEKRKKASVTFSAVALALMVSVAVGLSMQRSGLMPKSYIVFALDSNPDSYGNKIYQVIIRQNKTGSFSQVAFIDTNNYTQGMIIEIDANYPTLLVVEVEINKTLCSDQISLADDYTRVYLNVSTIYTDKSLLFVDANSVDGFYRCAYMLLTGEAWTPATDTTYEIGVKYEAYY